MQLAIYARSQTYDIATGQRAYHEADASRGIIIHLPATDDPAEAKCELHWVDLEAGWYAVNVATQVRDQRKLKFAELTSPFGPVDRIPPGSVEGNTAMRRERRANEQNAAAAVEPIASQIRACATADQVRELWTPDWSDELNEIARQHIAKLPAA
jgi:hypothetical protein